MANILVCDPVDDAVTRHFRDQPDHTIDTAYERDQLEAKVGSAHVLIVRSGTTVDEALLAMADELVGIVRAGVGLDNIDLEAADRHGVTVENTPEASTNAVAELTIGLILDRLRGIARADAALKSGDWIKGDLDGREIQGKVAGIVGFGRIGRRVGELLSVFGAEVIAHDLYLSDEEIQRGGAEPVGLDVLLEESDIITVHVPLTEDTRHLIGREELETIRDTAILVNCSRGGVYRESALEEALREDRVLGVALDAYETEPPEREALIRHPRTTTTPHIGASTREAQARIGQLVIDKVETMV